MSRVSLYQKRNTHQNAERHGQSLPDFLGRGPRAIPHDTSESKLRNDGTDPVDGARHCVWFVIVEAFGKVGGDESRGGFVEGRGGRVGRLSLGGRCGGTGEKTGHC